jgi:hypothetical protein
MLKVARVDRGWLQRVGARDVDASARQRVLETDQQAGAALAFGRRAEEFDLALSLGDVELRTDTYSLRQHVWEDRWEVFIIQKVWILAKVGSESCLIMISSWAFSNSVSATECSLTSAMVWSKVSWSTKDA